MQTIDTHRLNHVKRASPRGASTWLKPERSSPRAMHPAPVMSFSSGSKRSVSIVTSNL
jgi:hypothetical protein